MKFNRHANVQGNWTNQCQFLLFLVIFPQIEPLNELNLVKISHSIQEIFQFKSPSAITGLILKCLFYEKSNMASKVSHDALIPALLAVVLHYQASEVITFSLSFRVR